MSSSMVNNNAFEIAAVQNKRKRESIQDIHGNTNEGFSSTPKKDAKHLIETFNKFLHNKRSSAIDSRAQALHPDPYMEVKSISDIIGGQATSLQSQLSHEIVRKPPKKKKKHEYEEACFVNPALNLNCPETNFNPFEVKRTMIQSTTNNDNCFSNPALNIRVTDISAPVNPYEIARFKDLLDTKNGIENPALEPATFAIGLPFTPTLGCRINFENMQLNTLTSSNTKPVAAPRSKFRRSLSVISEEIDIAKELDCYQLELENSINEAKIRKRQDLLSTGNVKTRQSFDSRLQDLDEKNFEQNNETELKITETISVNSLHVEIKAENQKDSENDKNFEVIAKKDIRKFLLDEEDEIEDDFERLDDDGDDVDFTKPTPFVRAYTKPKDLPGSSTSLKSLNSNSSVKETSKSSAVSEANKNGGKTNVADVIRKSIRKFIRKDHKKETENFSNLNPSTETELSGESNDFLSTIRQSFRRRNRIVKKEPVKEQVENLSTTILDFKRPVFRAMPESNNENVPPQADRNSEHLERKSSLRSSLRKSTKGMKNHIMKSVFKKNIEEYQLRK